MEIVLKARHFKVLGKGRKVDSNVDDMMIYDKMLYLDGFPSLTEIYYFVEKNLDEMLFSDFNVEVDFDLDVFFGDELWDGRHIYSANDDDFLKTEEIVEKIMIGVKSLINE